MIAGNAVKRIFPGMQRECVSHGSYAVTEAMDRRKNYGCPKCASAYAVEYARRNREKKRLSNNAYQRRHSAMRSAKTARYRSAHPDRRIAHQAVQTAVRNGSLIRQACRECGSVKSHAHHDDYSKPLDVVWLCHTHHVERHAMLAERSK